MEITRTFLVPDYYPEFVCKCGECRACCCGCGWGIAVGMEEYFDLLGRDCSPELRDRLDTAFHLADDRSPEHYAMVTPKYDGSCRLQREDGLCMVHCRRKRYRHHRIRRGERSDGGISQRVVAVRRRFASYF